MPTVVAPAQSPNGVQVIVPVMPWYPLVAYIASLNAVLEIVSVPLLSTADAVIAAAIMPIASNACA